MNQLHSDGANNVHGEIMKELCIKIGTVKSKSSRLHPQGDGMAEAVVKILKNSVKKQVDKYGKDWDLYLQSTAFAVRSSINSSTKCTPAELVLGDNLTRPIDLSVADEQPRSHANKQAREFAISLAKKIDDSANVVNENLEKSRAQMKTIYDQKNSKHNIEVGNQVMLWWPYHKKGISRAFQPRWKGPYVVTRLIGNTNCTIQMENDKCKNVHLNQLKLVQQRNETLLRRDDLNCDTVEVYDHIGDLFDIMDPDGSISEGSVNEPEEEHEVGMDDRWCGVDHGNILHSRTRSGFAGEGDG